MSWYERVVFNRVLDAVMDQPALHAERRLALAGARGDVLEIGIGTGLNLESYPVEVERVTAVTLEPDLDERARRRATARGIEVLHVQGDGARLPFDAARFDTVVATFVLCTIPDAASAAREMRRVLRPSGRLLFLEHVIAPPGVRRFVQHLLDPLSRLVNCGCSPTRDTRATLAAAGFSFDAIDEHDLAPLPYQVRRVIRGVGRPGA